MPRERILILVLSGVALILLDLLSGQAAESGELFYDV